MPTLSIVGMHFRPPAKAFTQTMPTGQTLLLRREPTNPYDANAIMVRVVTESLPREELFWEDLLGISAGMGYDKDAILAEPEWHLGYIPKVEAAVLAEIFDSHGLDVPGIFGLDATGKPVVIFDPNETFGEDGQEEGDWY